MSQISDLNKTINAGLEETSVLGELGAVATAIDEFYKVRTAKHQKESLERDLKALADTSGPSGHQKLQVCDVCGAYLSRLDNDRRLADHFFGKMHLGYAKMRETYSILQKEMKGQPPSRHDDGPSGRGDAGFDDAGWGRDGGGGYGGRSYRGSGGGHRRKGGGGGYNRW